jgi:prepilin-type N-terminal cleavage/methylation domain-containing protein/prepilin-type processing-associated H-X9-DG protein
MKKRHFAFTLIEILITMAIIAIVSAIIFPLYFRQRAKTRTVTCLSNIKNQGVALRLYIEDNDGYWPTHNGLLLHVKNNLTLSCPDFTKGREHNGYPETGYAFNGGFIGLPPLTKSRLDSSIKFSATTVAIAEINTTDSLETAWFDNNGNRGNHHNGGGNFVFCDGHAKWYMPDAVMGLEVRKTLDGTFPAFANQSMDEVAKEGAQ